MSAHSSRTLALALILALGGSTAFAASVGGRAGGASGGTPGNGTRIVAGQQDCLALVACSPRPLPRPRVHVDGANHCGADDRTEAGIVIRSPDCRRTNRD